MYSENEDFEDEYNGDNQNNGNQSFMDKVKSFYEENKTLCLVFAGILLLLVVLLMVNSCSNNSTSGGLASSGTGGNSKIQLILSSEIFK